MAKFWRYTTSDDKLDGYSIEVADIDRAFAATVHNCSMDELDDVLGEIGLFYDEEAKAIKHRGICCCDDPDVLLQYMQSVPLEVEGHVVAVFEGRYGDSYISDGDMAIMEYVIEIIGAAEFVQRYS